MIKPGKYLCKVTAPNQGWFGESGENNTPFIRIPLVITQSGDCEGEHLEYQAWISDKSLDRTIKNLAQVFGWDGDLPKLAKLVNTGPFVDKECSITCEEETYKDKKRVVIKWLNAPSGAGKPMAQDLAVALAEKLARRAKEAADKAMDDIPF